MARGGGTSAYIEQLNIELLYLLLYTRNHKLKLSLNTFHTAHFIINHIIHWKGGRLLRLHLSQKPNHIKQLT